MNRPASAEELQRFADLPLKAAGGGELVVRRACDIEPRAVEWIWPGRFAAGKHTAIAGEPGAGKSTLTMDIAAAVTIGAAWPCAEGHAPLGNVVVLSAEDDAEHTLVPRLIAAGADLTRVHIIEAVRVDDGHGTRTFNLQGDLDRLEGLIVGVGDVKLVIVDPISSYMGKADSHKNSDVRGVLEPVSKMAERTRAAFLSVTHFSKAGAGAGGKALHRFIGSVAFTAAARFAFAVMADADDEDRRLFLHVKNNLAAPPKGLAFRLGQKVIGTDGAGIIGSHVMWESDAVDMTANDAMAAEAVGGEPRSATSEWESFFRQVLADGERLVKEVEAEAREAGLLSEGKEMFESKPARNARKQLGVERYRRGFQGKWYLSLPILPLDPNAARQNNEAGLVQEGSIAGDRGDK